MGSDTTQIRYRIWALGSALQNAWGKKWGRKAFHIMSQLNRLQWMLRDKCESEGGESSVYTYEGAESPQLSVPRVLEPGKVHYRLSVREHHDIATYFFGIMDLIDPPGGRGRDARDWRLGGVHLDSLPNRVGRAYGAKFCDAAIIVERSLQKLCVDLDDRFRRESFHEYDHLLYQPIGRDRGLFVFDPNCFGSDTDSSGTRLAPDAVVSEEEETQAAVVADERREEVPLSSIIWAWWTGLAPEKRKKMTPTDEVGSAALKLTPDRLATRGVEMAIGHAMKELGFRKSRPTIDGRRTWAYEATAELLLAEPQSTGRHNSPKGTHMERELSYLPDGWSYSEGELRSDASNGEAWSDDETAAIKLAYEQVGTPFMLDIFTVFRDLLPNGPFRSPKSFYAKLIRMFKKKFSMSVRNSQTFLAFEASSLHSPLPSVETTENTPVRPSVEGVEAVMEALVLVAEKLAALDGKVEEVLEKLSLPYVSEDPEVRTTKPYLSGWVRHPQDARYYYRGKEVRAEVDLAVEHALSRGTPPPLPPSAGVGVAATFVSDLSVESEILEWWFNLGEQTKINPNQFKIDDVMEHVLELLKEDWPRHYTEVGRVLKEVKFERFQQREGESGDREWFYRPSAELVTARAAREAINSDGGSNIAAEKDNAAAAGAETQAKASDAGPPSPSAAGYKTSSGFAPACEASNRRVSISKKELDEKKKPCPVCGKVLHIKPNADLMQTTINKHRSGVS